MPERWSKETAMAAGHLRDQIAQLAETLERCRKAMLVSKAAIGAGAIWIVAFLVGAVGLMPPAMVGAIAAVIGGVVLYGSNSSTAVQAAEAMKDAERLRAKLIDNVDPRTVGGGARNPFGE
jgi:hypothetical protein